jgi:hypothetical protein
MYVGKALHLLPPAGSYFPTVSNLANYHLRHCGLDERPLQYHKQCNMMDTMAVGLLVGKCRLQGKWSETIRIYKPLAFHFNVLFFTSSILYSTFTTSLLYIYIHCFISLYTPSSILSRPPYGRLYLSPSTLDRSGALRLPSIQAVVLWVHSQYSTTSRTTITTHFVLRFKSRPHYPWPIPHGTVLWHLTGFVPRRVREASIAHLQAAPQIP